MWGPKNPLWLAYKATFESSKRYRYDMLIWPKMGYNIISNISRILEILYHIIYPNMRYYIRYRYAMIYIFPTTDIKNKLKWDKNVSKCCMVYCIWQKELQTIFGYTRVNAIKSRLKDSVSSQVLIPSYITSSKISL